MAKLKAEEVKDGMEFVLTKKNFTCYKIGMKKDKNYRIGSSFQDNETFIVTKKPYKDASGSRMIDFLVKSESKAYTIDWLNFKNNTEYKL